MWTPTTRRQHSHAVLRHGCDLTDAEWAILDPFFPPDARCGRKRAYGMRKVVNAMCYVLRCGVAWRLMPDTFPPWRTVYADAGYQGPWVAAASPIRVEVVRKLEGQVGFTVHARR